MRHLLLALLVAAPLHAQAAAPERYVLVANGDARIGTLVATRKGDVVSVDWQVSDNGRGPKVKESIRVGADGLPRAWTIRGTGTMGGTIDEGFTRTGGRAEWHSQADRGSSAASGPGIYLANDASPYAWSLHLPALLAAPEHALPAWPSGRVRAERLEEVALASAGRTVTVWALWGTGLSPNYVLVDGDGRWAGFASTGAVLVPEAWAADAPALAKLAVALDARVLAGLTTRYVHRWDRPVLLRNVRVFDPATATLGAPTSVLTAHGRIMTVADVDVPDAIVVDGQGGTVVPGLFDAHAHYGAWDGPLNLAAGVTTVRDMGNDNAVLEALVAKVDSGVMMGPRVLRSGFLEGRSPFSANGGIVAESLSQALDAVRYYATHGFVQLKIYNSFRPEWIAATIAEAHRLGLPVAGHVPSFFSSAKAVDAGYDEITHVNQLILGFLIDPDRDDTRSLLRFTALGERAGGLDLDGEPFQRMLAQMQARHVAHDPTLATFETLLGARPGRVTPVDAPWITHVPAPVARARQVGVMKVTPALEPRYRASLQKLRDVVKLLHDRGIVLVPGTDDLAGLVLQSELEQWQHAGIPAAEVLRLATQGTADHLKLGGELGSVTRGKRADYLLVDGDPTRDVGAIRNVRMVMKDGAVIFPDELLPAIGIVPWATRPPVEGAP